MQPSIENDPTIKELFKPLKIAKKENFSSLALYARGDFIDIIKYLNNIPKKSEKDEVYGLDYHDFVDYCLKKLELPKFNDDNPLDTFLHFFHNRSFDNRIIKFNKDIQEGDKNNMEGNIKNRYNAKRKREYEMREKKKNEEDKKGYIKVESKDLIIGGPEYYKQKYDIRGEMIPIGKYEGLEKTGGGYDVSKYLSGVPIQNGQTYDKHKFTNGTFSQYDRFYIKVADTTNETVTDPEAVTEINEAVTDPEAVTEINETVTDPEADKTDSVNTVGGKRRKNKKSKKNSTKKQKKSRRRQTLKKTRRRCSF
jgi:hypothetical protein